MFISINRPYPSAQVKFENNKIRSLISCDGKASLSITIDIFSQKFNVIIFLPKTSLIYFLIITNKKNDANSIVPLLEFA